MTGRGLDTLVRELSLAWCRSKGEPSCAVREEVLAEQAKAAEGIERSDGVILLKAPTGFGKTEIWTAPFFAQWLRGEWFAPRLYVVEPMHALLRQMKRRMEVYAQAVQGLGLPRLNVAEDHGEVAKPLFLYGGHIVLTTVDSLAYGYLARRVQRWREEGVERGRYSMPAGLLASAYIVLDEAHLIQDEAYLGPRVLGKIVCDLASAGAKVVISTATVPETFLKHIPCLGGRLTLGSGTVRRNVEVERRKGVLKAEEIECGRPTIVIVNTIERARRIYKQVRCGKKAVVHSLMRREDRERQLSRVLADGKVAEDAVLIGTQALEVGLDFSNLRALYTETAPVDALIQRIGRVGRDGGKAEAYIYEAEGDAPYPQTLMQATREALEEELRGGAALTSWEDAQRAVDRVYNEKAVEELMTRGLAWYGQALGYLQELSLFSYPPRGEVRIRPSSYITLVIADVKQDGDKGRYITEEDVERGAMKMSYTSREDPRINALLQKVSTAYTVRGIATAKDETLYYLSELRGGWDGVEVVVVDRRDVEELYDEAGLDVAQLSGGGQKRRGRGRRRR
ncbi:CRISPR-associated helicase Cas3' [Pyrobaculum neutrophilum]|uniref:CRISPR-associated helicase Cas3 n=1 Tax=Pyrobaculum neutrophilum (strain DSM 2338 / JCM 9278 / NBRC 100436 / V24Sta) TaxID=444157 RepID=B1YE51_PYRNV|nr:CRISPR-associated helicase Cas3' [Pyrobaculum neutrophilum]ACB40064.1 CRISPR-associated helicase Cas3 [Pyrobaculum neutrophilum V24Sta]